MIDATKLITLMSQGHTLRSEANDPEIEEEAYTYMLVLEETTQQVDATVVRNACGQGWVRKVCQHISDRYDYFELTNKGRIEATNWLQELGCE